MGVAFQCMVRLTVYAMSYKLYVVEWYDRRELVREAWQASRFALDGRTKHANAVFFAKWTVRLTALTTQNEKSSQPFHRPTRHLPSSTPCYSTP
jgi:hypothetical protein